MVTVQQLKTLIASEGLRSSVLMIFGNVFAQGMSGVSIILLSRFIGPEEFGLFSTGFSVALIFASVIDLGLSAAQQHLIPRASTNEERNTIFATAMFLKLVLFGITALLVLAFAPFLHERLQFSSSQVIVLIVLANIGSVFFNQLGGILLSIKRVAQTVVINSLQAMSKLILAALVFGLGWRSGETILFIYLMLPLVVLPFVRQLLPEWFRLSVRFDLASWLRMRSMALNNWVASFGAVLIQNADIVLVSMYLSQQEAGLMGAASRLAMFIALIGGSLSAVLNPRVSTYQSGADISAYWRKALVLLAGSSLLALISFFASGPLISLTVGDEYQSASQVLGWLLAASWLGVGLAPISALFYSYDKPWYFSISAGIQALILVAGTALLLPQYGIIAAGWVRLSAQLVIIIFTLFLALQSHRKKYNALPRLI